MYIPIDDTQNYPFCRLQLMVEMSGHYKLESTNQSSRKVPIVLIRGYKTLGTSVRCPLPPNTSQKSLNESSYLP